MTSNQPLPKQTSALVVSGFLGSGKTTLVRRLLRHAQETGIRVAIVSNEFGALGIDQALLAEGQAETYVELEGGCVCCQLSNELRDTLQLLWERARPDRVIVETSGVALPADTQLAFWREPVSHWIADDIAVVVVDAQQVCEGRDLAGTFEDQVTSADLILLNKIDLVPSDDLPAVEAALREIEPEAPIVRSVHAAIDPALIFPPDLDGLRARRRAAGGATTAHDHEQFAARELTVEDGVAGDVLIDRLRALAPLRAKGFVHTDAGLRLVQGVGNRVQLVPVALAPRGDLIGRVVVIERRSTPPRGGRPD